MADVCSALKLTNVTKAASNLTPSEVSRRKLSSATRARPNNVVSEQGLDKLIFQSRKPEAREFQDWVFGTVLPAIRKDGGYIENEEKVVTGEVVKGQPEERLNLNPRGGVLRPFYFAAKIWQSKMDICDPRFPRGGLGGCCVHLREVPLSEIKTMC